MNVFDKFLGRILAEDLTETTWWADTVFRGLEEDWSIEQVIDSDAAAAATQQTSELL